MQPLEISQVGLSRQTLGATGLCLYLAWLADRSGSADLDRCCCDVWGGLAPIFKGRSYTSCTAVSQEAQAYSSVLLLVRQVVDEDIQQALCLSLLTPALLQVTSACRALKASIFGQAQLTVSLVGGPRHAQRGHAITFFWAA